MHKIRRIIIIVLFFLITTLLVYGLYHKNQVDLIQGHRLVGIAVALGVFVLMPMFIYHRWKDKSVKDYMLTQENIEKMRDFNNSKED